MSVQPFWIDLQFDKALEVSGFDCFHPSEYAHRVIARGLWNNMLQPPGAMALSSLSSFGLIWTHQYANTSPAGNKSRTVDRDQALYLCPDGDGVLR